MGGFLVSWTLYPDHVSSKRCSVVPSLS